MALKALNLLPLPPSLIASPATILIHRALAHIMSSSGYACAASFSQFGAHVKIHQKVLPLLFISIFLPQSILLLKTYVSWLTG